MKKGFCCLLALLLLGCTGCTTGPLSRTPIEDMFLTMVMGIDYIEGQYTVTLYTVSARGKDDTPKGETIAASGTSLAEAAAALTRYAPRQPFFGYADHVLLGEAAVRQDLKGICSALLQDDRFQMDSNVVVAHGASAADVLTAAATQQGTLSDLLTRLENNTVFLSGTHALRVTEVLSALEEGGVWLPYLACVDGSGAVLYDLASPEAHWFYGGYATLSSITGLCATDPAVAMGRNWCEEKIGATLIVLEDVTYVITHSTVRLREHCLKGDIVAVMADGMPRDPSQAKAQLVQHITGQVNAMLRYSAEHQLPGYPPAEEVTYEITVTLETPRLVQPPKEAS